MKTVEYVKLLTARSCFDLRKTRLLTLNIALANRNVNNVIHAAASPIVVAKPNSSLKFP